jgi:hypothetical protein
MYLMILLAEEPVLAVVWMIVAIAAIVLLERTSFHDRW